MASPVPAAGAAARPREERLRLAASLGHTEQVEALIAAGTPVTADVEGRTALHLACAGGHAEVVAALLSAGCDANCPEKSGHTPLQRAAAEGHVQVVQQLIQKGVTVDHQDEVNGNTALHEAAWKGYSQSVDALLRARANMYLRNRGGFTALHLACQNGHNQTCRLLLLAGCSPDISNSYGDTPLHTSARYGHAGVMRILISGDASLSEQNKNGDTALHIAAAMGRRKLTRILLDGGVDYNLRNKQEESALQIALRKEHVEIVEMISNPPEVTRLSTKREEKRAKPESGSSSKEGSGKHIDKKKKSSKVHFEPKKSSKTKKPSPKWSPYGCFYPPDMTEFPQPRLDTLPKDPLGKGEQYYLDLSGNIRKGPVGEGYTCYCAPFFRHVEDKLDKDKHELIHHIDLTHGKLDKKIASLEKRTRTQLTGINELMRERFSRERAECANRAERVALRTRTELERRQGVQLRGVKDDLTAYLEGKFTQLGVRDGVLRASARHLHKARSEELLTDISDDDDLESGGSGGAEGGLRVLQRPSEYPPLRSAGSLSDLRRRLEQEDSTETAPSEPAAASPRHHPLPLRPGDTQDGYGARPKHGAVLEVRNAHLRAGTEPWPGGARVPPGYVGYPAGATDSGGPYSPLAYNNPGYVQYEPLPPGAPAPGPGAVPGRPPPGRQFRPLELEETTDQHNDSGYSTKIYGSSQGPSPALSGVPEDEAHLHPSTQLHHTSQPSPSHSGRTVTPEQSGGHSQSPSPAHHPAPLSLPPGQTGLHPGQTAPHPGQTAPHPGQTTLHPGQTGLHLGQTAPHPGQTALHPGQNGLHPAPNGLHPAPNGLHPVQNGLHPAPNGLHRGAGGPPGAHPAGRLSLGPRIQALQTHLARITEDMSGLEQALDPPGIKSSLV
ncbi:ankyrin repeat domain-containing protein 6-like isoform X1 [Amphibalanus amphitrite]|uniref:ankyrin repeat domain-containing protein 6-like isoform X1 n=1 Tax=Amphibalanus amphitrite TaxID=1232801 RepID=UPI001C92A6A8|nr:ankyrin repeat domain-containing protein 6-like isoform X1 [Amphibalanus amphitrite]